MESDFYHGWTGWGIIIYAKVSISAFGRTPANLRATKNLQSAGFEQRGFDFLLVVFADGMGLWF
jgi:hypothetical protein